jgi:hypothetical protein
LRTKKATGKRLSISRSPLGRGPFAPSPNRPAHHSYFRKRDRDPPYDAPRYLCFLLKANNTSFSELVWQNRLPRARDQLVSPQTRDYPIHEIAHMSGFKSAAHFSRMFKSAYGMAPREFRMHHVEAND